MENNINKLKRREIDKNQELKNKILSFISENKIELDWVSNFKQIIYHYINDIEEIPKCYCSKFNNFKSSVFGYRKTCSFTCSNRSLDKKIKISEKKLEKYGDENYNNPDRNKETKKERYGDENYNNREKAFKTNETRYGSYSPMKNEKVINLGKMTKLKNHGDRNYNNIEKIKEFWNKADIEYINGVISKTKKTKLKNHGDENYNNVIKMIKTKMYTYGFYYTNSNKSYLTRINNGNIKTGNILIDWKFYKREVARFTRKNKKELFENWNGYDYYDDELIKGYLSYSYTHRFYPTLDHKISIYFGFVNKIPPDEIGCIDNLCITKRYINSTKHSLTEEEFLKS